MIIEKENSTDKKSFTYKPEKPMELPEGVKEINKAFQNKELLKDIEVELHKIKPNGKSYHIDEVFGIDEKGMSKFEKADQQDRKQLKIAKCKLYVIGGAVRDFLLSIFHPTKLHKKPKNYNLATDARPKIVELILLNAGIKAKPGKLGTTIVTMNEEDYEIDTFREEGSGFITYSTPGRDALRRDFRINALRYDIDKEIVEDDVGGFGDLVENPPKLKTIGSAKESFKKDPIRVLRALRIHGKINGSDQMDTDIIQSLKEIDLDFSKIDVKKIHDEFMEGLKVADDQNSYISNFINLGKTKNLLQQIFPNLNVSPIDIPHNTHPHVVLALILKNNNKERVEAIMKKMGFTDSETSDTCFLLSLSRYYSENQINDFYRDMREKVKRLIPTAIRNYIKWAKLGNRTLIEKFLKYKS